MTNVRVTCVAGILLCLIADSGVAQPSIRDGALQDWMALKDTMMKIADAMPEDKFTYRATPAERTWGEQILHVAEANVNQIGRLGPKAMAPVINMKATSRVEILKALADSFDYGTAALNEQTEPTGEQHDPSGIRSLGDENLTGQEHRVTRTADDAHRATHDAREASRPAPRLSVGSGVVGVAGWIKPSRTRTPNASRGAGVSGAGAVSHSSIPVE